MTIYFTSDLHFGHESIIDICDRPFLDVEEMNDALIENINRAVKADDELWILGDFSFRMPLDDAIAIRRQILCKNVHLVRGNHDKDYEDLAVFSSVQDYKELKTEYGKIVLFHYPIASWNGRIHGWLHLHGHIHSGSEYNEEHALLAQAMKSRLRLVESECEVPMIWDVGVDANGYAPISLDEIAERLGLGEKSSERFSSRTLAKGKGGKHGQQ